MTCPNADTLSRFAEATLADHEAIDVVAHLAVCETCARRVDELEQRPEQPMMAALRDLQDVVTDTDDPPLPQAIGQYEILEKIGAGGMGVVYRAVQPHLEREVAIKVIKESRLTDPTAKERFKREIQAVGRLRHPNIVQAHDAGFVDDRPYLVMEFLHGVDLGQHIKRHGKLGVETASAYIRQAALGLQHAHEAGIVHRDIKPSNLFLLRDGTVKILDLGLATLHEAEKNPISWRNVDSDVSKTLTGHIIGSLDFLSPEQALGLKAESSSDIYSLGCTFYYLLSGKPPLDGEHYSSVSDKLAGHIRNDFPKLHIPRKTDAVLRKMVAKTPAHRYASAGEVAKVLVVRRIFRYTVLALLIAVTVAVSAFAVSKRDDGAETYFNSGTKKHENYDHTSAVRDLTEAIRRRPKFPEAYFKRASSFGHLEDYDSAAADYAEVIRLQPDRATAYYFRATCLARSGKIAEALHDLDKAVDLNPNDAFSLINRAEVHRRLGKPDLALADINEAIRFEPRLANVYNIRGLIRKDQGDSRGALDDFSEAIHYGPTMALAYSNRGLIHTESGDHQKGLKDLNKAVELDPREPLPFNNRGLCKLGMGRHDEAVKDFDEAIRLSPTLAMAYSNRGLCNTGLLRLDDAISDLNKAIELDPGMMHAYHNKGRVLLLKEDFAGAETCFSKAISLRPDFVLAHVLRAVAHLENGNKEQALSDLSREIDSASMTPKEAHEAYLMRSLVYDGMGEKEKAAADAVKAEELKKQLENSDSP